MAEFTQIPYVLVEDSNKNLCQSNQSLFLEEECLSVVNIKTEKDYSISRVVPSLDRVSKPIEFCNNYLDKEKISLRGAFYNKIGKVIEKEAVGYCLDSNLFKDGFVQCIFHKDLVTPYQVDIQVDKAQYKRQKVVCEGKAKIKISYNLSKGSRVDKCEEGYSFSVINCDQTAHQDHSFDFSVKINPTENININSNPSELILFCKNYLNQNNNELNINSSIEIKSEFNQFIDGNCVKNQSSRSQVKEINKSNRSGSNGASNY